MNKVELDQAGNVYVGTSDYRFGIWCPVDSHGHVKIPASYFQGIIDAGKDEQQGTDWYMKWNDAVRENDALREDFNKLKNENKNLRESCDKAISLADEWNRRFVDFKKKVSGIHDVMKQAIDLT